MLQLQENQTELQIGDHVYQWRKWMGIPGVFQHHGIVMDIIPPTEGQEKKLIIADFSNVEAKHKKQVSPSNSANGNDGDSSPPRRRGLTQEGILRTYTDTDKWHKVEYEAAFWKRQVYRAGTCTGATSDAAGMVSVLSGLERDESVALDPIAAGTLLKQQRVGQEND